MKNLLILIGFFVVLTIQAENKGNYHLQPLSKLINEDISEDFGKHTFDGVTYHLFREYDRLRAKVIPFLETQKYEGSVYVPEYVYYNDMEFEVEVGDAFTKSPNLKSLSVGSEAWIEHCPQLTELEIRKGTKKWGMLQNNDALETITFPNTLTLQYVPVRCKSMKEIHFLNTNQVSFYVMSKWDWSPESMPSLTDIYFSSDYPPIGDFVDGQIEPNPKVTIHIPVGTLSLYRQSAFGRWNIVEDQPAIPLKWAYFGDFNALKLGGSFLSGFGLSWGNNDIEFAIGIPSSHLNAYKGCKVTKIEFLSDDPYNPVEYVFITNPDVDYLVKQPVTKTFSFIWNTVELEEPYIITGEKLYIGIGGNKALFGTWANENEVDEGMYLRIIEKEPFPDFSDWEPNVWYKNGNSPKWKHPLAVRFYIEGENLPNDVILEQSEPVEVSPQPNAINRKMAKSRFFKLQNSDKYRTINFGKSPIMHATQRPVVKVAEDGHPQILTTIRSRTKEPIQTLTIDWNIDDSTYMGSQRYMTDIILNHEENLIIDLPTDIKGRNHQLSLDVTEINGEPDEIKVNSKDTIFFSMPVKSLFKRKIVLEEVSGTWCGWCPAAIEASRIASLTYPENYIPIGLHYFDAMYPDNGSYDEIIGRLYYSVPNGIINRTEIIDPRSYELEEIGQKKDNAVAKIDAKAMFVSTDSTIINVSTETSFGFDDDGSTEYRIAYVVLEDSVGPYPQDNYYSHPEREDDPDNLLNDWVHSGPVVEMLHNHVARGIYPSCQGEYGSVPNSIIEGETYSHDFQFVLPQNIQNMHNIYIVTLLIDGFNGEILNAAKTAIVSDPTDIVSITPSNEPYHIYNVSGQRVQSHTTNLDGLPNGIYIINRQKVIKK